MQTKFTNANVAQGQHFMAQCVVEIFGLDLNVAYEVGPAISPKRNLSRNRRAAIRQPQCAIRNKPAVVVMLGLDLSVAYEVGPAISPKRNRRAAISQPHCAIRNKPAVVEMLGGPQRLPRRRVRS